ncbi:aspartic peptidase domain-containing protein [Xylariaceae sp. FL1019]|nr:aspartic peptidase domain-containing protein [Xylariaceae sp. FL1019]
MGFQRSQGKRRSLVAADCFPYPISLPIGNVSLSNGQNTRGSTCPSATPFKVRPFYHNGRPMNNTLVYGLDGYCIDPGPDTTTNPIDGNPYPQTMTYSDVFRVNENATLPAFEFGQALSDWSAQGYHPMMAFGTGSHIGSRVWSMFYGWTGGSPDTQLDGTFMFGGYDRAKVAGEGFTQKLRWDPSCPTSMFVTIEDIVLNFPNGTDSSIVAKTSNGSFPACIVPDYPVLMTLPTNPYFDKFQEYTNTTITQRSLGQAYYSLLYNDNDAPYKGDMSVIIGGGPTIRVPNSQLVVPERTVDPSDGKIFSNISRNNLVFNPIQDVNLHDLSQLGRQFLSSAYVMVNQDSGTFTLWAANPTTVEDIIGVESEGAETTNFCVSSESSTSTGGSSPASSSDGSSALDNPQSRSSGLSTGAIVGIAKKADAAATESAANTDGQPRPDMKLEAQYHCANSDSTPSELHGTGPTYNILEMEQGERSGTVPRAVQRYELY